MNERTIAVLAGDGIGPEVMREALRVLRAVAGKYSLRLDLREALIGGAAIDAGGRPLPPETLELCRRADAVLLGSIGGPDWDHLPAELRPETAGLLALRRELGLYANLRPVTLYPELQELAPVMAARRGTPVDLLTVRELSGGVYFGKPQELSREMGLDTMVYRRHEVERIARLGFDLARKRRGRVTSVDKANVLRSSMLWRQVVTELAAETPGLEVRHMYVDNAAMQLILDPGQFDVLLTENLFGDILSDESAALAGSLGLLPSASLGASVHLYEPAGGSAPDIAGSNIANPLAQILCVALLLEHSLECPDGAADIRRAVRRALQRGCRTADIAAAGPAVSTEAMGRAVCAGLEE